MVKVRALRNNEHSIYIAVTDEKNNTIMNLSVRQPKCDETKQELVIEPKAKNIDIQVLIRE